MNLYDQLVQLQVIDNAYMEWTAYRNQLTDYLIKEAKGNKSIAIFGAGRCNDIDLKRLVSYFDQVTLFDKDELAMQAGINHQGVAGLDKIQIKTVDFIGISSEDYRNYADTLINEIRKLGMKTNCQDLAEVARREIQLLDEKAERTPIDFGTDSYETTVVVGVHSQLLSMLEWIWCIMLQTIQQDEVSVRNQIIELNDKYVKRFNEAVINATDKNMIIGCEQGRIGKVGTVQGAVQAIDDINRRMINGEVQVLNDTELEWLFNKQQGIAYLLKLQSIGV